VKEFAKQEGLTYAEFGFVDGNQEVIGVLKNVAEQVKILREVAKTEVKEALSKKMAACDATPLSKDRDCKKDL
jgi:sphingolipid 8-(E)-desaturase